MEQDVIGGDVEFRLQSMDQRLKLRKLAVGESPAIAIADQADANRVLIVMCGKSCLARHMGAGLLLIPAVTDMNDTVAKPVSVADQEVVSKALITKADVLPVDGVCIAGRLAEVMNHDSGPPMSIERLGDLKDWIRGVLLPDGIDAGEQESGLRGSVLHGDQESANHRHRSQENAPDDAGSAVARGLARLR